METSSDTIPLLDEEDDDGCFYFESDHLALRGNKEYSDLLKTIVILDAQRTQAVHDYDKVVELHTEALNDPYSFIQKLVNGEDLGVPDLQKIVEIPVINWSKYNVPLPAEALKFINSTNEIEKNDNINFDEVERDIRSKSSTFNKQWTTEEQKRLEELLVAYPPEPIEHRRFKKIAAALGNRTVKQVSSRVQKYFQKLYQAGLPIPGRIPKTAVKQKKSKLHSHQRHNHYLFKPTTFFPQLDIPVVMNETEHVPGPSKDATATSSSNFSNYLIPDSSNIVSETREDQLQHDEDMQLQLLQQIKTEKQNENNQAPYYHVGYRCDYCDESPISGTRWNCQTCKDDSIDFCCDCLISQMYSNSPHPFSHKLIPIRNGESIRSETVSSNFSSSESDFDSVSESETSDNEGRVENFAQTTSTGGDDNRGNIVEGSVSYFEEESINKMKQETTDYQETNETDNQDEMLMEAHDVAYSYLHSNLLLNEDDDESME